MNMVISVDIQADAGEGGCPGRPDHVRILAARRPPCHHAAKQERRSMSDIGSIFSTWDIVVMILAACAPGLVLGAIHGAWKNPGRRLRGATIFGLTGFGLAFAGWWIYLTVIK
jgi:hypothetical protein